MRHALNARTLASGLVMATHYWVGLVSYREVLAQWSVVSHHPLDSRQQPQFCDATGFGGHICR
jgi:hypothetical protein